MGGLWCSGEFGLLEGIRRSRTEDTEVTEVYLVTEERPMPIHTDSLVSGRPSSGPQAISPNLVLVHLRFQIVLVLRRRPQWSCSVDCRSELRGWKKDEER
jgi:hypothetical protein